MRIIVLGVAQHGDDGRAGSERLGLVDLAELPGDLVFQRFGLTDFDIQAHLGDHELDKFVGNGAVDVGGRRDAAAASSAIASTAASRLSRLVWRCGRT